jgi:serine/threonine protein phosphatase PrpC
MGGFLDAPIRDKNPDPGSNEYFQWGACAMQGWRSSMEDTHICQLVNMPNKSDYGQLFGVFDGHGGAEVSDYAKLHFKNTFMK